MKKILLPLLISVASAATAQTTAMDFTKNDCNSGTSHNLFSELDAGQVIVMEFAMVPTCAPCINANHKIEPVVNSFAASHPGRVRMYAIAYNNVYTCSDMNSWATANSINSTLFDKGSSEVSYYGGMGMPTVVVVGNASHTVYYKKIGFVNGDTTAIRNAITTALTATAVADPAPYADFTVSPVPVSGILQIQMESGTAVHVEILDATGRMVREAQDVTEISVAGLSSGIYFARVTDAQGATGVKKIVVAAE